MHSRARPRPRPSAQRYQPQPPQPPQPPPQYGGYDPSGFHGKRREFDPEWDNDAETVVSDMEFTEFDSPEDVQQKLAMLLLYNRWGSSSSSTEHVS